MANHLMGILKREWRSSNKRLEGVEFPHKLTTTITENLVVSVRDTIRHDG